MLWNAILLAWFCQSEAATPPKDGTCGVCFSVLPFVAQTRETPVMTGIQKIAVRVTVSEGFPVSTNELTTAVELRLRMAGIPVIDAIPEEDPVVLQIIGHSLCSEEAKICTYTIRTRVMERVFLARSFKANDTDFVVADTWMGTMRLGFVGKQRFTEIKDDFIGAADEFANAYLKANPKASPK